jgi:serine/threonine protein kinase
MLQQCGPFELLRHIATGGMAEIFLARRRTTPSHLVVIKRMLPDLAARPDFVEMFIHEGKLTSGLVHPHVVRVEEVGQADADYFIAMELVDGPHLGSLFAHSLRARQALPLELCAWVVARAAEGLEYAHTLKDPRTGQPLNLVHRDVSPQNILVSKDGEVKVTDFGVAKASTQQTKTRTGILKGKVSYMSPEQCLGDTLDHRTDVFALGIVLYELLTRRRLFRDKSDLLIMQRITGEDVAPSSSVNALIDPGLDAIVMKSLARDVLRRYQSTGELSRDLDRWLRAGGFQADEAALARWFATHCPELAPTTQIADLLVSDAPKPSPAPTLPVMTAATPSQTVEASPLTGDDDTTLQSGPPGSPASLSDQPTVVAPATNSPVAATVVMRMRKPITPDAPPVPAGELHRGEQHADKQAGASGSATGVIAAVVVAVLVAVVVTVGALRSRGADPPPPAPPMGTLVVQTVPADVPIVIADRVVGRSPVALQRAPGPVVIQAQFPDQRAQQRDVVVNAGQETAIAFLALVPVIVRSTPPKAAVRINGELLGETPFERGFLVEPNVPLALRLDPPGPMWTAVDQQLTPKAGEPLVVDLTLPRSGKKAAPLVDAGMGRLSIRTDPDGVIVSVGKERIDETPFAERPVKAGRQVLVLRRDDVGLDERLPVTIPKDGTLVVKLRFEKDGGGWKLTSKTIR